MRTLKSTNTKTTKDLTHDTKNTCAVCHGTGNVVCEICNGKGKTESGQPCASCSSKGRITCPACAGNGNKVISYGGHFFSFPPF